MSFLKDLVQDFTGHHNQGQGNYGGQGGYGGGQGGYGGGQGGYGGGQGGGYGQGGPNGPPPDVPRPWYAEWDGGAGRWIFVNGETGERTFDFPSYGGGGGVAGWAGRKVGEVENAPYRAEEDYDQVKYGTERRFDRAEQRVEDLPEDAAYDAGHAYDRVEEVPGDVRRDWDRTEDRVENGFDRFGQDVEDVPEDIASGAGKAWGAVEAIGGDIEGGFDRVEDRVENFGDGEENAFDAGRDEERNDNGW